MKKLFALITAILISIQLFAQAPHKMSYQAVIRNASNLLVTNAPVTMKISILQGSATGTAVYSELHSATTNANGLVSIEIGAGTSPTGTFSSINWGSGTYFLKTETDPANGTDYSILGASQLLSVPYALESNNAKSAENAKSASDGVKGVFGDTLLLNNGKKYIIPGIKEAPSTSINNGLVAYYPFNGNANDESGYRNNGIVNGATLTTDRFENSGKAYYFGGNNLGTIGIDLNLPYGDFSFSFWYNAEDTTLNSILGWRNKTNDKPLLDFTFDNGKLVYRLRDNNNSSTVDLYADFEPLGNKWQFITLTLESNIMKIYINGILNGSAKYDQSNWTLDYLLLGNNYYDEGWLYSGKLDDIRIYNRVLTQEEITYLANN